MSSDKGDDDKLAGVVYLFGEPKDDPPAAGARMKVGTDRVSVVRFVNLILIDAWHRGASEIHVRLRRNSADRTRQTFVSYFIDGAFKDFCLAPTWMLVPIIKRLKELGGKWAGMAMSKGEICLNLPPACGCDEQVVKYEFLVRGEDVAIVFVIR